jgi:hypothetical protein
LWDSEPYRPTNQERHGPRRATVTRQTLTSSLRSRSTSTSARQKPTQNTCTSAASPAPTSARIDSAVERQREQEPLGRRLPEPLASREGVER